MHFLYILTLTDHYNGPANWDDTTNATLGSHWNYLVDLHKKGVTQLVGRTSYSPGHKDLIGLAVFTAENQEQAAEIMNNDPCVKEGVMTAVLHPFNLSLIEGKMPEG
ncbi:MAG: YCII-related domain protein [Bacteroidetes bacterium]|nr:YCII-related domain protein [Bacteroidota bacterium]